MCSTPSSPRFASASNPFHHTRVCGAILSILALATPAVAGDHTTAAPDDTLLAAVPDDALVVYSCNPDPTDSTFGQSLSTLISAAGLLGVFGREQQNLADTVSVALALCKYPHVLALLDVACKQRGEGSFSLDRFSAAIIVDCRGEPGQLLALLKQILDHYFTRTNATLRWAGSGPTRRQVLTSADLPEWCVWQWGQLGDCFVVTVGPDAYDRVARRLRATGEPARRDRLTDNVIIETTAKYDRDLERRLWLVYLSIEHLDDKLRPVFGEYTDQIRHAFGLDTTDIGRAERITFSAGFTKRAFISKLFIQSSTNIMGRYVTDAIAGGNPLAKSIPPQATAYAVAPADVSRTVAWAVESYLATRNPTRRNNIARYATAALRDAGLTDIYRDVFDHLAPRLIVHDWPAHPLNWPFAKTFVIAHDGATNLKKNWNTLMAVCQTLLAAASYGTTQPATGPKPRVDTLFEFQLTATADDVWFLHVGPVVLAAAVMTDDHLILSWSAPAVGANVAYLAGGSATQPRGR